jgi:hypothetical protein
VVSGQLTVVGCQWSVVSGQWSVVSGHWSVVSGQWSVVSGQWSVVKKYGLGVPPSRASGLAGGIFRQRTFQEDVLKPRHLNFGGIKPDQKQHFDKLLRRRSVQVSASLTTDN